MTLLTPPRMIAANDLAIVITALAAFLGSTAAIIAAVRKPALKPETAPVPDGPPARPVNGNLALAVEAILAGDKMDRARTDTLEKRLDRMEVHLNGQDRVLADQGHKMDEIYKVFKRMEFIP